jgi:SOS-response transcriptional repressor LexA
MPPATVIPIAGQRQGVFVVLEAALPERPLTPIGVLLIDPASDRGWVRLRERFDDLTDDPAVLEALEPHLRSCLAEHGAEAFLQSLEDSLSNVLRVSGRQAIGVDAFTRVLEKIYGEHVESPRIEPFRTHLPLYSLRAAAGRLGEEMASDAEDWVPLPEGVRPEQNLFVAQVVGRSMEPRIPDGSLNLFRANPVGSRQGKILLIQRSGVLDETARYTIKRYTSRKRQLSEDEWTHEQIRLEPLNPEFEAWDVEPQDFAVVAEWLRVIE